MTTDASETMKSEELKRLGFLFEYGALAADCLPSITTL